MKISVCLATFNGEKYLQQQIESILIQLGDNDELIISDDGSSDQTLNIIESFSDNRIHIFHNKMNHGFIGNFENALRIATIYSYLIKMMFGLLINCGSLYKHWKKRI